MKTKLLLFLLFLSLTLHLFAQHTINYKIKVYHLGDSQSETIDYGTVREGEYILFPSYTLTGDIQNYQDLYNVVKGSSFVMDSGALAENVTLIFNVMSFDENEEQYYFDHNLFFYMGVQVDGERTGWHDFDDVYPLQTGKYAYIRIPKDTDLHYVLNLIGLEMRDIDFAYHTRAGYTQEGIKYTELTDSLQCRLSHFSKFGGGRGGVLPVELQNFTAELQRDKVVLSWETATETNNYGFEVLKQNAADPEHEWKTLGFVEGAGNSNSPRSYKFTDNDVTTGKYYYMLRQIDLNGTIEHSKKIKVEIGNPVRFELFQNYPNPFNPVTTIKYSIPSLGGVETLHATSLRIYNILGKEVATLVNEKQAPGNYSVQFDASNLPSGIYFYTLRAGNFTATKKMILLKEKNSVHKQGGWKKALANRFSGAFSCTFFRNFHLFILGFKSGR